MSDDEGGGAASPHAHTLHLHVDKDSVESQEQVRGAFNACQGRSETERTGSWRGLGAEGNRGHRVMSQPPGPTAPREAKPTSGIARDHQAGSGAGSPSWTADPTGPLSAPAEMKSSGWPHPGI